MEGRITGWYMLLIDIDDRKRAEDALRSNEQNLRLIVDTIPGFVSTANAAGEVELVNRSRRADGVYHWFQVRALPQRDADGRIVRWYNLATDIDERKRAEVALTKAFDEIAKSEAELRTIIDAIPQLIVAIGADGKFLKANQAVLEYTGLTKEEVSSQSFGDVFHPEDTERLHDQREAAISRGVPFEYERRVRHRDGQYRWFLRRRSEHGRRTSRCESKSIRLTCLKRS